MSQQVLEGAWEEIAEHADELSGKRVKLIVLGESLIALEGEAYGKISRIMKRPRRDQTG